jgi:DNA polymerase-3 subunit delta
MRVVILAGAEAFLRQMHAEALRLALVQARGGVDVFRFEGERAAVADVLDECRTIGLMGTHKLVIVDDAELFVRAADEDEPEAPPARRGPRAPSRRELLERYAAAPCEHATLVLRSASWRAGRLDELVREVGAVVECKTMSDADAARWARSRARAAHGVRLEEGVSQRLVEMVGADLGRLDGEVAKLALAAGPDGAVTQDLIDDLVGPSRDTLAWTIQSGMLTGDAALALSQLDAILGRSQRDMTIPATWACVDLARKLHAAGRAIRAGVPSFQVRSALKLWGDSERSVSQAAMRLDPHGAAGLLHECVLADAAQKSGLGRPRRTLERLVVRLTHAVAARPGSR